MADLTCYRALACYNAGKEAICKIGDNAVRTPLRLEMRLCGVIMTSLIKRWSLSVAMLAMMGSALATTTQAPAQDLKIGVVNMERILSESKLAKQASDRLNQEAQQRQNEIEALSRSFKARLEKFERNAKSMSESQRLDERRALAEMERDVTRRAREEREESNQRRNEEVLLLQSAAARVIKRIAQTQHLDLVLYEYFYASARVDLTNQVIAQLDQEVNAQQAKKKR